MRSILNSGNYLISDFLLPLCSVLLLSLICVFALCWTKLHALFLFVASHISRLSNPLWISFCLSLHLSLSHVCLSLTSCNPLGSIPGYFPTLMSYLCWEHVSLLLPLTPSSSHTGCLMAPSTTFCMKAPVSIFTRTQSPQSSLLSVVCRDLCLLHICHNAIALCTVAIILLLKPVKICHSSCFKTLWWTRRRRWSLLWTLLVEWPSYTHLNRWSLATILTAKVWW